MQICDLDRIRASEYEYQVALEIAADLFEMPASNFNRWHLRGCRLLAAVLLHTAYTPGDPMETLQRIAECPDIRLNLREMCNAQHDPSHLKGWLDLETGLPAATHPDVARTVHAVFGTVEIEWPGIWINVVWPLRRWLPGPEKIAA